MAPAFLFGQNPLPERGNTVPFNADLGVFTAATVVVWAVSGALSVVLDLVFAAGSLSSLRPWRLAAIIRVNVTRGVLAGLLVIAAGIGMMRVPGTPRFPAVFPGTLNVFQHVGWAIVLALALSLSGHLAMTFRAAALALGRYRRDQVAVLGLSLLNRTALLARECAAMARYKPPNSFSDCSPVPPFPNPNSAGHGFPSIRYSLH